MTTDEAVVVDWPDPSDCPICGRDSCEDVTHVPPSEPLDDDEIKPLADEAPDASIPDPRPVAHLRPGLRSVRPPRPQLVPRIDGRRFPTTDSGNAEFFAHRHGDDVRFDHRRGRWLLWAGHRWQPDVDGEVNRLAKGAVRQRLIDATQIEDQGARNELARWAVKSEARSRIDAMLYLAQAESAIADAGETWDADPLLLGVSNGVVDLETGMLRDGRRADQITLSTAIPFDPDAACPRWLRFLTEIFAGDAELVAFVTRAVGYSLTGLTTEQALFVLYGTGANGKSTFTSVLKHVLGDYGWNMPFTTIEAAQKSTIPNDMAALAGRRFVVASETNDGTRLNEARVKALTGCEPITARFLHQEFFEFEPVAKFWLAVNHKPIVRDDSHGFWRRIRLVPFTQTFPVDHGLVDELRTEASGILAWAVRGSVEWQRRGLRPPETVTTATAAYERDSDPLADFLDEAVEIEPDVEIRASELFEHYRTWAETHGLGDRERLSATAFGRKVGERFASRKIAGVKRYVGLDRRRP